MKIETDSSVPTKAPQRDESVVKFAEEIDSNAPLHARPNPSHQEQDASHKPSQKLQSLSNSKMISSSMSYVENKSTTRRLLMLRVGVFVMLGGLIALIGSLSYLLTRSKETENFTSLYQSCVDQITTNVDINIRLKLGASVLVQKILEGSIKGGYGGPFPYMTMPGFENFMSTIADLASARGVMIFPIVTNDTRRSWEEYATTHVDELHGPEYLKNISAGNWPVSKGVWSVDTNNKQIRSPGYNPHSLFPSLILPQWQTAPIDDGAKEVLFDAHMSDVRMETLDRVIASKTSGFTDILYHYQDKKIRPSTDVYAPILSTDNTTVLGIAGVTFSWDNILQDAAPTYISDISCVLSTTTTAYTFHLSKGQARLVGKGDLHDSKFNKYRKEIFVDVTTLAKISATDYTITIYPTSELYDQYITSFPGIICASAVVSITFTALLILLYDYLQSDRERKLEGAVQSTTKLTSITLQELEMKKNFVRYISHEIRTPLNTVKIGLDVLQRDVHRGIGKKENLATIGEIQQSCGVCLQVINDLLLFDKIMSDSLTLEYGPANILTIIKETVNPFYAQAQEKGIIMAIMHELSETDIVRNNICVDKTKFSQVIRNIVSNALKFTPRKGSITIRISKLERDVSKDKSNRQKVVNGNMFVVDFIDTGTGISQEMQEKLFKDIVHFESSEVNNGGGSGLGMYLSQGIIKQHKGTLQVHSEGEGQGTTFTLEIPVVESILKKSALMKYIPKYKQMVLLGPPSVGEDEKAEQQKVSPARTRDKDRVSLNSLWNEAAPEILLEEDGAESPPVERQVRVLVVDDAASNRKMLCRMLYSARNFVCDEAVDGLQAVEKVKKSMGLGNDSAKVAGESQSGGGLGEGLAEGEDKDSAAGVKIELEVADQGDLNEDLKQYDFIIMDYIMPNLTGPAAVKQIRDLGYDKLIIGATGHADDFEIEIFKANGADKVLVKPIDLKALHVILDEYLDGEEKS